MIAAQELRAEVVMCLRAGPKGWTACQGQISPASKWLVSAARGDRDSASVMADFASKFGRDRFLYDVARQALCVLRTQIAGARDWKSNQDANITDAFPAAELIVLLHDVEPFPWKERWIEAGGKIIEGRAVAMKSDPIWAKFSEFGQPYPPFDWLASLGWEDVDQDEARRLGVITATVPPAASGSGCAAVVLVIGLILVGTTAVAMFT